MSHRLNRHALRLAAAASAFVFVAACAADRDVPTASLAVARTSIAKAEADNAPQLAPVEYQNARDKLVRADEAVRTRHYTDARRLADESAADADVAQRKARAIAATNTAIDTQRSNAVLSSEVNKTETTTTQTVVTPTTTIVTPAQSVVPQAVPGTQTTTTVTTQSR